MKNIECIAQLDKLFYSLDKAPKKGDIVAIFSDGGEIVVDGKFVGKGTSFFGAATGIRWHCEKHNNKGLFGKGIACYMGKQPSWIDSLPNAK